MTGAASKLHHFTPSTNTSAGVTCAAAAPLAGGGCCPMLAMRRREAAVELPRSQTVGTRTWTGMWDISSRSERRCMVSPPPSLLICPWHTCEDRRLTSARLVPVLEHHDKTAQKSRRPRGYSYHWEQENGLKIEGAGGKGHKMPHRRISESMFQSSSVNGKGTSEQTLCQATFMTLSSI